MAPPIGKEIGQKSSSESSEVSQKTNVANPQTELLIEAVSTLNKNLEKNTETIVQQNEFSQKATASKKEQLSSRSTRSTTETSQSQQTQANLSQNFKSSLNPKNAKNKKWWSNLTWSNLNPLNLLVSQAHASPKPSGTKTTPKTNPALGPVKKGPTVPKPTPPSGFSIPMPQWVKDLKETAETALQSLLVYGATYMFGGLAGSILNAGIKLFTFAFNKLQSLFTFLFEGLKKYLTLIFKTITFPLNVAFKIMEKMTQMGVSSREEMQKIDQALSDTRENFSSLSSGLVKVSKDINNKFERFYDLRAGSKNSFYDSNSFLSRTFGQDVDGIVKMISSTSETLNSMQNFAESFSGIFKSPQQMGILHRLVGSLGLEAEDIAYHSQEAVENNKHVLVYLGEILTERQKVAKINKIDEKRLGKFYNTLRKDITNFDSLSDKSLLNISAKFQRIGLDADNVSEVINKFSTFEDAAKSAAMLSQSFGMYIDPLKLIETDNPLEIINMFEKGLKGIGRTFESMNRHERKILTDNTGLSMRNIKTLMMYRKQGLSMEAAQSKLREQDPTERQIKALTKLTEAIDSFKESINIRTFASSLDAVKKAFTRLMTGIKGKENVFTRLNRKMQKFGELIAQQGKHGKELLAIAYEQLRPVLDSMHNDPRKMQKLLNELTDLTRNFYKDQVTMKKEFLAKGKKGKLRDLQGDYAKAMRMSAGAEREAKIQELATRQFYKDNSQKITELIGQTKKGQGALGSLGASWNFGMRNIGAVLKAIGSASPAINDFLFDKNNGLISVLAENIDGYLNSTDPTKKAKYKKKIDELAAKANVSAEEILQVLENVGTLAANATTHLINLGYTVVKGIFTKLWNDLNNPTSTFYQTIYERLIKPIITKVQNVLLLTFYSIIDMLAGIQWELWGMKINVGDNLLRGFTAGYYSYAKNLKNLNKIRSEMNLKPVKSKLNPSSTPATPTPSTPPARPRTPSTTPTPRTPSTTPKTPKTKTTTPKTKTKTTPSTTPATPASTTMTTNIKSANFGTKIKGGNFVLLPTKIGSTRATGTETLMKGKGNLGKYFQQLGKGIRGGYHSASLKAYKGSVASSKLLESTIDAMVEDKKRPTGALEKQIKKQLEIRGNEIKTASLGAKARRRYKKLIAIRGLMRALADYKDADLEFDTSGNLSARKIKRLRGGKSMLDNLNSTDSSKKAVALMGVMKRLQKQGLKNETSVMSFSSISGKNKIMFGGVEFPADLKMFDPIAGKLVNVFKDGNPNPNFFMFKQNGTDVEKSASIVTGYGTYYRKKAIELINHLGAGNAGDLALNEGVEAKPLRRPMNQLNQEDQQMMASNNTGGASSQQPNTWINNIWMDTVQVAKQVVEQIPTLLTRADVGVQYGPDGRIIGKDQQQLGVTDLRRV